MKKIILSLTVMTLVIITAAFSPIGSKLVSKTGHVNFFSHTAVEDITADNYKLVSTIDTETGELIYTIPMQSFEFEKSLMQKHFNSDKFLDTKTFPKSKFKGMITNLSDVNLGSDGVYNATVSGDLTIHGETNTISEKATITVAGGTITVDVVMDITLADYGIAFTKGKPSKNIAKTVKATVKTIYN
jgi:polyisoprenoid-binding protein YceI